MTEHRARCMTPEEVAEFLNVTPRTLKEWRVRGEGPPFIRQGRTVRYVPRRVQLWMDQKMKGQG